MVEENSQWTLIYKATFLKTFFCKCYQGTFPAQLISVCCRQMQSSVSALVLNSVINGKGTRYQESTILALIIQKVPVLLTESRKPSTYLTDMQALNVPTIGLFCQRTEGY
jgi:hypothetical protein